MIISLRNLFLSSTALVLSSSIVLAQELPDFQLTLDGSDLPAATTGKKKSPIDSALSDLQNFFLNLTPEQQAQAESEAEIPIKGGMVTIEAIAKDSADDLLEELTRLGMIDGASAGKMVSGQLPITVVGSAELLSNLQFMRIATQMTRVGSVDNQADVAMRSNIGRVDFGVDGSGITIGIISDSYNLLGGEAVDIASGDIPAGVVILDDGSPVPGPSDEGRAMAQLIHDIAPGADLIFHTGFKGAADFATGIQELAAAGADVIVDDVGNLAQPMFQDGIIAQSATTVVNNGVAYFSSAGNSADRSYEAPYVDSGLTNGGLKNVHNFDPGGPVVDQFQEFLVAAGASVRISLQWDQPFASSGGTGASSDIDAYIVDINGNIVAQGIAANVGGDAVEILGFTNTTGVDTVFGMIVGLFNAPASGPVPGRLKWIEFSGGISALNHATNSSTSFGHPNAEGAIGVGAARYDMTPPFGVDPPVIESFSSLGGLEILFDTAGNPISPVDRAKPEIVAPDGSDTSFFGGGDFDGTGFPNFFGTSAAAPHAAAVAALQLECNPSQTPGQIEAVQTLTAIDMETPGFDNISGNGLIDAQQALASSCPEVCNGFVVTVNLQTGMGSATSGNDVILGTPGPDMISGFGGDDTICALGGDDIILAGNGDDYVEAGEGDDFVSGSNGVDVIFGDLGDDEITGGPLDDFIDGGPGNDILFGNRGDDFVVGDSGIDEIKGGSGDDEIFTGPGATVGSGVFVDGGSGDDIITGGPDADLIRGSADNDTISGLQGDDQLFGGSGEDIIGGDEGDDLIRGNSGNDNLSGGDDNDNINGFGGKDTITGGAGNDVLNGSTGNDTINGNDGNDEISGGGGNDVLSGDAGIDVIQGGGGDDSMDGGGDAPDTCDGQGGTDAADASCEVVTNVP